MYCPKCGAEIDDDALFCPKCGCSLKRQDNPNTSSCYAPDYKRTSPTKKPLYKKWWFWILALVVAGNIIERIPGAMREQNQREAAQVIAERTTAAQAEASAEADDGYTEEEQAAAAKEYYEKIGYDPTQEEAPVDVPDDGISVVERVGSSSGRSYSGSGDDYIDITPLDDLWYMEISGNQAGSHFAVKGYNASDDYAELFVNTTDPYKGSVFELEQSTRMLEITASDSWSVNLRPLSDAPRLTADEAYSGIGDAVLLLPSGCTSAQISGNDWSRHFAVKAYGDYFDLLVNTVDPYSGRVRLERNAVVLTVTAEGGWTITVH